MVDALLQFGYILLTYVEGKRFVQGDFFSFSHRYYTFYINYLITKLYEKLEVGETAKLLQKLFFKTKYLSYVQTKNYPPLPHLWEVRDKR